MLLICHRMTVKFRNKKNCKKKLVFYLKIFVAIAAQSDVFIVNMFTLPPRPPKDYYIEDVPPTQQSGQEFTPDALPRVTQSNLGKFCAPIEGDDEDKPTEVKVQTILPSVLDRWTYAWRAYWVPKPGENAYYLHDIYKKHTVLVDPDYNPIYKHMRKKTYMFRIV